MFLSAWTSTSRTVPAMSSTTKRRRKVSIRDITPERKGPMPDGLHDSSRFRADASSNQADRQTIEGEFKVSEAREFWIIYGFKLIHVREVLEEPISSDVPAKQYAHGRNLSYLGRLIEKLIWACPCESSALYGLGLAKEALVSEGRYFEKEAGIDAGDKSEVVPLYTHSRPDHAAALDGQPEESKETPVWTPNMVESIHADADRLGKKMGAPKTDAEQPDHAAALADAAEKLMGLMCMDSQDFDMPIGQAYDSLYRKIAAYRASQKGGA